MGRNALDTTFNARDDIKASPVDDFDFDRISRDEITNINLDEDSPGN